MTDDQRKNVERELAELKRRIAQLEQRPASSWTAAERSASREIAARVKRLMLSLIDDPRQAGSAG